MPHIVRVDDVGRFYIDEERQPAHLTFKEAAVLRSILSRRSTTTKEMLLQDLYSGVDEPNIRIVDVFVCKVRYKLGDYAGMIETVWGRGYALNVEYAGGTVDGGMVVELDPKISKLVDEAAFEGDTTAPVLVNMLLTDALKSYRARIWGAAA